MRLRVALRRQRSVTGSAKPCFTEVTAIITRDSTELAAPEPAARRWFNTLER
jgi:hypothetical protein